MSLEIEIVYGPRKTVLKGSPLQLAQLLQYAAKGARERGLEFPNGTPERGHYNQDMEQIERLAETLEAEDLEYVRGRGL